MDGLVTVFFFGTNMGGNAQANIERWIGQMSQPDGKLAADRRPHRDPRRARIS